ncbi:hypothetical protein VOLCADRAFT_86532 [Volvox carteri f. nagariensis]|uniref:TFIIS N-terminal domain-containing protein n=1 Tax=Volvox carteri f. nagariensis TaxID=3068 RepID=D8TIX6_VOLCA|nr:uncharacterized protein VOLCADRAFT_86532 [Volvox carteri f. nagariensis]EFJ52443.1 hypothetical protein VOLCADRAFT_86532 [Volvox carteri f. nagariensis]|eukprot:XP_002946516.1 hypothetical protein VOLCADRAFT_86532 [Volvox carteri f. nagariensis]
MGMVSKFCVFAATVARKEQSVPHGSLYSPKYSTPGDNEGAGRDQRTASNRWEVGDFAVQNDGSPTPSSPATTSSSAVEHRSEPNLNTDYGDVGPTSMSSLAAVLMPYATDIHHADTTNGARSPRYDVRTDFLTEANHPLNHHKQPQPELVLGASRRGGGGNGSGSSSPAPKRVWLQPLTQDIFPDRYELPYELQHQLEHQHPQGGPHQVQQQQQQQEPPGIHDTRRFMLLDATPVQQQFTSTNNNTNNSNTATTNGDVNGAAHLPAAAAAATAHRREPDGGVAVPVHLMTSLLVTEPASGRQQQHHLHHLHHHQQEQSEPGNPPTRMAGVAGGGSYGSSGGDGGGGGGDLGRTVAVVKSPEGQLEVGGGAGGLAGGAGDREGHSEGVRRRTFRTGYIPMRELGPLPLHQGVCLSSEGVGSHSELGPPPPPPPSAQHNPTAGLNPASLLASATAALTLQPADSAHHSAPHPPPPSAANQLTTTTTTATQPPPSHPPHASHSLAALGNGALEEVLKLKCSLRRAVQSQSPGAVGLILSLMAALPVSPQLLADSQVAAMVSPLQHNCNAEVAAAARRLITAWKGVLKAAIRRPAVAATGTAAAAAPTTAAITTTTLHQRRLVRSSTLSDQLLASAGAEDLFQRLRPFQAQPQHQHQQGLHSLGQTGQHSSTQRPQRHGSAVQQEGPTAPGPADLGMDLRTRLRLGGPVLPGGDLGAPGLGLVRSQSDVLAEGLLGGSTAANAAAAATAAAAAATGIGGGGAAVELQLAPLQAHHPVTVPPTRSGGGGGGVSGGPRPAGGRPGGVGSPGLGGERAGIHTGMPCESRTVAEADGYSSGEEEGEEEEGEAHEGGRSGGDGISRRVRRLALTGPSGDSTAGGRVSEGIRDLHLGGGDYCGGIGGVGGCGSSGSGAVTGCVRSYSPLPTPTAASVACGGGVCAGGGAPGAVAPRHMPLACVPLNGSAPAAASVATVPLPAADAPPAQIAAGVSSSAAAAAVAGLASPAAAIKPQPGPSGTLTPSLRAVSPPVALQLAPIANGGGGGAGGGDDDCGAPSAAAAAAGGGPMLLLPPPPPSSLPGGAPGRKRKVERPPCGPRRRSGNPSKRQASSAMMGPAGPRPALPVGSLAIPGALIVPDVASGGDAGGGASGTASDDARYHSLAGGPVAGIKTPARSSLLGLHPPLSKRHRHLAGPGGGSAAVHSGGGGGGSATQVRRVSVLLSSLDLGSPGGEEGEGEDEGSGEGAHASGELAVSGSAVAAAAARVATATATATGGSLTDGDADADLGSLDDGTAMSTSDDDLPPGGGGVWGGTPASARLEQGPEGEDTDMGRSRGPGGGGEGCTRPSPTPSTGLHGASGPSGSGDGATPGPQQTAEDDGVKEMAVVVEAMKEDAGGCTALFGVGSGWGGGGPAAPNTAFGEVVWATLPEPATSG